MAAAAVADAHLAHAASSRATGMNEREAFPGPRRRERAKELSPRAM